MKQITMVFRMIAVCAVLALFAGCSGGFFADPGHGGAGGAFELSVKPEKLSDNATFEEAAKKLDEIIAYCDKHPGTTNDTIKYTLQEVRDSEASYWERNWNNIKSEAIYQLNTLIAQLE